MTTLMQHQDDVDPFTAAEDAHGAANPESHKWLKNAAERYVIAFLHFEECETREGKVVETIVGKLKDGTYSREWLFPPDDPDSRGWRAQELEFIESTRSELQVRRHPGDGAGCRASVDQEPGSERPSVSGERTIPSPRRTRPSRSSARTRRWSRDQRGTTQQPVSQGQQSLPAARRRGI